MKRIVLSLVAALALSAARGAGAQPGNGLTRMPSDAALAGLAEIWVGTELRGTGILMDDEALTVVTAHDLVEDGRLLGVSIRMNGETFTRKAEIVAHERNYGLTLLRPSGTPDASARTDRFAGLPAQAETLTLIGCFCVIRNMHGICTDTGVGFGDVTVHRPDSGILPHPYRPPTQGLMIVALPGPSPVPLTGGMGVFSPVDGRLVGIVAKAYDDQLLVVPASTVIAMLDSLNSSLKRK